MSEMITGDQLREGDVFRSCTHLVNGYLRRAVRVRDQSADPPSERVPDSHTHVMETDGVFNPGFVGLIDMREGVRVERFTHIHLDSLISDLGRMSPGESITIYRSEDRGYYT